MSALLAILAAGAPVSVSADEPVSETAPEEMPEIVVVAERLKGVKVHVGQDQEGSWYCSLSGSSGVLSLDKRLCKAVTKCVRKGASEDAEVESCVKGSKKRLLARFEREYRKRN